LPEHRGVDVGQHHVSLGAHLLREGARQVAGPAGEVKNNVARPYCRLVDRVAFPEAMQPGRHQVVHDVVTAGDRIEDVAHEARLLFGGDRLVTEMGRVVLVVHD
jgi:hypothetical protein